MAQPRVRGGGARLARRLGLDGARGVVAACLVIALGAGGVGVARAATDVGVVIERSGDAADDLPDDGVASDARPAEAPVLVVHVDGAVASPGVYELSGEGLRVMDAVEAAGGLLKEADTSTINLASPLVDGSKVHIPSGEEVRAGPVSSSSGVSTSSSSLININMATEAELVALPGVGEATAAAIVRDREANGPFASIEDIMRVSGIGEKKFERMRDMICV